MNNKQTLALVLLGIFVIGSGAMFFSGRMGVSSMAEDMGSQNVATSSADEESYDDMMARMHPKQASTDANEGMDTISLSEVVGQVAPDFTLKDQKGKVFTLSENKDKTVVLFFSGGAMCYPACWDQIEALGKDKRFNSDEVVTFSIVVDSKEKWDQIIEAQPKYGVGTILMDTNTAVSQAYDMLYAPSSMHKGRFPGHTYLIVKDGVISYVLDDPTMSLNTDEVASNL